MVRLSKVMPARLEAIHIILSFTTNNCMRLHQMNVKYDFMNDIINEEVYVKQPCKFESNDFLNHKVFYELKQAPCAWYEKLSSFLMENGFKRGKVDTNLFRNTYDSQFIIVQIYVDDAILELLMNIFTKSF
ncbi:hypothetical protein CR513_24662, partial [Mucuna pruriens]